MIGRSFRRSLSDCSHCSSMGSGGWVELEAALHQRRRRRLARAGVASATPSLTLTVPSPVSATQNRAHDTSCGTSCWALRRTKACRQKGWTGGQPEGVLVSDRVCVPPTKLLAQCAGHQRPPTARTCSKPGVSKANMPTAPPQEGKQRGSPKDTIARERECSCRISGTGPSFLISNTEMYDDALLAAAGGLPRQEAAVGPSPPCTITLAPHSSLLRMAILDGTAMPHRAVRRCRCTYILILHRLAPPEPAGFAGMLATAAEYRQYITTSSARQRKHQSKGLHMIQ